MDSSTSSAPQGPNALDAAFVGTAFATQSPHGDSGLPYGNPQGLNSGDFSPDRGPDRGGHERGCTAMWRQRFRVLLLTLGLLPTWFLASSLASTRILRHYSSP